MILTSFLRRTVNILDQPIEHTSFSTHIYSIYAVSCPVQLHAGLVVGADYASRSLVGMPRCIVAEHILHNTASLMPYRTILRPIIHYIMHMLDLICVCVHLHNIYYYSCPSRK